MPNSLAPSIAALAIAMLAAPALAQQPTDEQISAIRASCRSDFMAHCVGVPRGGADALRCLKQNVAQLSPGCQAAVNAVGPKTPAAAPAAAPAPAPATPAPAAAAPPAMPAPSAPATVATPPAAPPAASAPAATPATKPVATPAKPARPAPPSPTAAAVPPPAPAAPPAAAQPAALGPIPPLPPRARLMILRACAAEHQAYCANVPAGGGRIVDCLAAHGAALSPGCRDAIVSAR